MKKIQILLLLMLMVLFTGCSKDENVVNIGLLRVPNDAMLAVQMGLFEEKFGELGYEVNYYNFDSGTEANQAIVTGQTDFATMGNINGLVALGRYLDAELIWIHETLGAAEALVVKESANINTVEDFEGKDMTIATPFASTAHYILLNVLAEAGMEDEVHLLNMNTSSIVAAWQNGSIDAAYTWLPTLDILVNDGGKVLVSSEDMIEKGYMTANIELVRKTFSEEHPELVQAYIECMAEANIYFIEHRQDAIDKLAIELDVDAEDIEIQVNGSNWTSLSEMQSETFISGYVDTMFEQTVFLLEQSLLDRVVTREEVAIFINNSYTLEVENEESN